MGSSDQVSSTRSVGMSLARCLNAGFNSCRRYASKILIQRFLYAVRAREVINQRTSRSADDWAFQNDLWPVGCNSVRRYHGPGRHQLQTCFVTRKEIYRRVDEWRSSAL